jgi:hypothetical protein
MGVCFLSVSILGVIENDGFLSHFYFLIFAF